MAWAELNLGTNSNVGDGDDLRTAFTKVKDNFVFLKQYSIETIDNIGGGQELLNLSTPNEIACKTILSGNNINLTSDYATITISADDPTLSQDPSPTLSGNLNTNGFEISNPTLAGYGAVKINDIIISKDLEDTRIATDESIHIVSNNGRIFLDSQVQANTITAIRFDGPTSGLHSGTVIGNVSGNVIGNTTGTHVGNVIGNVSNIDNHSIRGLSDVSDIVPNQGDILKWNNGDYIPGPLILPTFTTAERDLLTALTGMLIFNTTTNKFQGYTGSDWADLS